jgi:hypothetical protein
MKYIKKMLLNENGELSFSKLGVQMAGIGGFIITLPTMDLGIVVPVGLLAAGKIMVGAGLMIAGAGARDAMTAGKSTTVNINNSPKQ